MKLLSVIVPCYNEEEALPLTVARLTDLKLYMWTTVPGIRRFPRSRSFMRRTGACA